MHVPAGFLLAAVPLGTDLVQVLVRPLISLEATDMITSALLIHPNGERLDTQGKCHHVSRTWLGFWCFIDKGGVVVPPCIPTHSDLAKATGRPFGKARQESGHPFVLSRTTRRQDHLLPSKLEVHRRVAEREELLTGPHPREAWRF